MSEATDMTTIVVSAATRNELEHLANEMGGINLDDALSEAVFMARCIHAFDQTTPTEVSENRKESAEFMVVDQHFDDADAWVQRTPRQSS